MLASKPPLCRRTPCRRTWLLSCATALVAAAAPVWGLAQEAPTPVAGQRIFYTGHSFHMFVPALVEQLAKSANIEGHKLAGTQSIGGSRVIQHWDLADEKNKAKPALSSGGIDVFTMAAHVMIPDEGITRFVELGLQHNPNTRFLIQASWFPYDIPDLEKRIKDNAQRDDIKVEELQPPIDQWRGRLEAQVDELNQLHKKRAVYIVPVGDAVVKLRAMVVEGKFPGVTKQSALFTDPIGHAQAHVQALAACCNYATIYRKSPEGLALKVGSLTDEQRTIIEKLAWETVQKYPYAGVLAEPKAKP